jgi:hypothetical protein
MMMLVLFNELKLIIAIRHREGEVSRRIAHLDGDPFGFGEKLKDFAHAPFGELEEGLFGFDDVPDRERGGAVFFFERP